MADRGLELCEDLSPLWQIEGLSYMETSFYYADRGIEQDEGLPPLWKNEGLT